MVELRAGLHRAMFWAVVMTASATAQPAPYQIGEIVRPLHLGTPIQGTAPRVDVDEALVVEFWATWCAGCRESIPHLNELQRTFANEPIKFIHITDEDPAKVRDFLTRFPIEGVVTSDLHRTFATEVMFRGLPATVLLDRNHRLVAVTEALRITPAVVKAMLSGSTIGLPDSRIPQWRPMMDAPQGAAPFQALTFVDIRPSLVSSGGLESPDWYRRTGVSIAELLSWAYQIPAYRIELPPDLSGLMYDVSAAVPPDRPDALKSLVQSALAAALPVRIIAENRPARTLVLDASVASLRPRSRGGSIQWKCTAGGIAAAAAPVSALQSCIEAQWHIATVVEGAPEGLFEYALQWSAADPDGLISALASLGLRASFEERQARFLVATRLPLPRPPGR